MKKNNLHTIKNIVFCFFLILLCPFLTSKAAKASNDTNVWYNQDFKQWYIKVYDETNPTEIFGERYTATQVQWVLYGVISFIMNQTGDPAVYKCLMEDGKNISDCAEAIKKAAEKLISLESDQNYYALNTITQRPVSFLTYITKVKNKLNPVKEVKAQEGFGYSAASSIQGLWQISRDLSYFLLVIVVVAFAFMIMFRVKISPQAVISVQSALPKIITTLVLITFSYAIAGFLIDLMYVVIGIISFLFAGKISDFPASDLFKALTIERSIFSLMVSYFFTFGVASLYSFISGNAVIMPGIMIVLAIIVIIVALIVLFFTFFKILWLLIKNYALIVLNIASAPFQILVGVLSSNGGFGSWLKNMVALLSVYPVVGLMFLLSFLFLRGVFDSVTLFGIDLNSIPGFNWLLTKWMPFNIKGGFLGENPWNAPLTAGEKAVAIIYLFVSFAIITLIPKIADIIKSMIEGKPFAYGTAIGEAIQPARTIGGGAFAGRYAYYTSTPPGETSGPIHKVVGGLYQKASPQARSMLDQTAKTIQGTITGGK